MIPWSVAMRIRIRIIPPALTPRRRSTIRNRFWLTISRPIRPRWPMPARRRPISFGIRSGQPIVRRCARVVHARRLRGGADERGRGDQAGAERSIAARVPRATLFALGRYQEAAGIEYAVLSAGPGWDWTTLSSLYPNVDTYTKQLRALEEYRNQHPDDGAVRFLLASQYITCGYNDNAVTELKSVVKLNPKDQLSQQLIAGLTTTAPPADQPPATPASPPLRRRRSMPRSWPVIGRPSVPTAVRSRSIWDRTRIHLEVRP